MTLNGPLACSNCGAALIKQWWNTSKGGYECRRCGAITASASVPKAGMPAWAAFALALLVVAGLIAFSAFLFGGGTF